MFTFRRFQNLQIFCVIDRLGTNDNKELKKTLPSAPYNSSNAVNWLIRYYNTVTIGTKTVWLHHPWADICSLYLQWYWQRNDKEQEKTYLNQLTNNTSCQWCCFLREISGRRKELVKYHNKIYKGTPIVHMTPAPREILHVNM